MEKTLLRFSEHNLNFFLHLSVKISVSLQFEHEINKQIFDQVTTRTGIILL